MKLGGWLARLLVLAAMAGCKGSREGRATASAASSASAALVAPAAQPPATPRRLDLLAAEHRRDASVVTEDDLGNRDVRVRRLAARALARIADTKSAELLSRVLADEDPEAASWAAYGLGFACKGREPSTVRALVARAASMTARAPAQARTAELDLLVAVADGLARCGTGEAERTLRAWLETRHADEAALALGKLASRHGRLDDASVVALLDAASRPNQPLDTALFAFTRLGPLGESVQTRLLEVAREALGRRGTGRRFAIRALGRAGPGGEKELGRVLASAEFSPPERADAARELARMAGPGQSALAAALPELSRVVRDPKALSSAAFGPLVTVLESLSVEGAKASHEVIGTLADAPIPDRAAATVRRRLVRLRCRAASLLAGRASLAPRLTACDPDPRGRLGALAQLTVLERGPLTGARHKRWSELAESADPIVRQAAIALMPSHPEIRNPQVVLTKALHASEPGTVAAAAEVLAAYPDRASAETTERATGTTASDAGRPALKPHPDLIKALGSAFDKADERKIETRAMLIDAAGALQILSFLPRIEQDCKSSYPTLRQHSQKALGLLGARQPHCEAFTPQRDSPRELAGLVSAPTRLRFETDVGTLTLTLDPGFSPVAVTRIVELARNGFYDGSAVHRVVPGFVAQLGDPIGDGYGGADAPPLRCETSPVSFAERQVGVALSGRDTGSSQIFVTLGPYPHLDGDYALIGRAEPGWDALAQGDLVRKVTVQ